MRFFKMRLLSSGDAFFTKQLFCMALVTSSLNLQKSQQVLQRLRCFSICSGVIFSVLEFKSSYSRLNASSHFTSFPFQNTPLPGEIPKLLLQNLPPPENPRFYRTHADSQDFRYLLVAETLDIG